MAKRSRSRKASSKHVPRSKRRNLPMLIGIAAVVAFLGGLVVYRLAESAGLPGERFASQGNAHISLSDEHPAYNSNPPTSGWHTPDLAAWGTYDYLVPEERLIHNMEDGGIVMWYRLGSEEENAARIAALQEASRGFQRIVIAPREEMPTTYALTAWQRLQRFEDVDPEGMREFIDAYHGVDHHSGL